MLILNLEIRLRSVSFKGLETRLDQGADRETARTDDRPIQVNGISLLDLWRSLAL